jgi:hypothetical protein
MTLAEWSSGCCRQPLSIATAPRFPHGPLDKETAPASGQRSWGRLGAVPNEKSTIPSGTIPDVGSQAGDTH